MVTQMVQASKCVHTDLHTSAKILHVCIHKNGLTMFVTQISLKFHLE